MMKQWADAVGSLFRGQRKYRTAVMGTVGLLCVCAMVIGLRAGRVSAAAEARDLPIYNVQRDDKVIAISFDAAWGDEQTQPLMDILAEYQVKTTFFVVGEWVDKYPEQVKALAEAGHEVMNHSNKHPHMTKLSREEMAAELNGCNDKIEAITGVRPILFRAPYGDYNNAVVGCARDCGMFTIQWDVDSLDWKDLTPAQIRERVVPKVKPGSIVLFHNGGKHTPEALPAVLKALQEDGYRIVPVSELIYRDNYSIDHAGMQVPKVHIN